MREIIVRVPSEFAHDFQTHWKLLRQAEGLGSDADLRESEEIERFDGVGLVEWILPLVDALTPVVTAALGYLVARRGEVEIVDGDRTEKYKNLSPSEIERVRKSLAGTRPKAEE